MSSGYLGSRNFFAQIFRFAYFTASALGLAWMLAQYGQVNFISSLILLPAFAYFALHLISLINLVKKDKFLVGSSVDVLSLGTQKLIHRIGLLLPVPILLYMFGFALNVSSYNVSDAASYERIVKFSELETTLFGKSVIWSYLPKPAVAVEETPIPDLSNARSSEDVDFGPYIDEMQVKMKSKWNPPSSNESHLVKVAFKVAKNGVISAPAIAEHVSQEADAAALSAVRAASPLKPLPEGAPDSVDIEFSFNYNVYLTDDEVSSSDAGRATN